MPEALSIQEQLYPDVTCFGCGHANPDGLHLRSYVEGDLVVAEFTPWPQHGNGVGFVNGGIVTTLLDCHGGACVVWETVRRGWREPGGAGLGFITAGFDVRFRRPTPLGPTVQLSAWTERVDEQEIMAHSELALDGKVRAEMSAVWKRFIPR
jgi:acyl-coenzyme A thioesterase PaaI-like protein